MTFWHKLKLRTAAMFLLARVFFRLFSRLSILDLERSSGTGPRIKRLVTPLKKKYRQEQAGKLIMSKGDLVQHELLDALCSTEEEVLAQGLENTVQSLVLWACHLRNKEQKE